MTGGTIQTTYQHRTHGRVATVTIDHTQRANTLGSALLLQLAEAFDALAQDGDLRAVVLAGAGTRAFIGGADLREMAGLDPHTARAFIARIHRACAAIRNLPVPVVARIHGACLGAGLELAASCDLRLAAETAVFGMPEVRMGIPSVVEAALLPLLIGWGRTRRMLLLGETVGAADAATWGLVERTVPPDALDEALDGWLDALLASPPAALRSQKALMRRWEDLPLRAAIDAGIDAFADAYRTGEPASAMHAYLAARRSAA